MRIQPSRVAALALAALILAGQLGPALAAEAESKSKPKESGAKSQSTTQVTINPATPAPAPGASTPEEMQKSMQSMVPMWGRVMTAMLENVAKKLSEPQIAEYYASFMRNYYLALIKQGFTEEQALKIVTATGVPAASHQR